MKKLTLLVAILTVCLSLTGCGEKLKLADANRKLTNAREEIEELKDEISNYETNEYEYKAQIDSLQLEVDNLTIELDKYINQEPTVINVEGSNEYYENLICELNAQVKSLQSQIAQLSSSNGNVSYPDLQNQITNLKLELENYKTVAATLQQQLNEQIALNKSLSSSSNSSYIDIKFWSDGYMYYANNVTWYSDSSCNHEIPNQDSIVIVSPIKSYDEMKNGYMVYTCRSTTGLIYSPYKPSLKVIE